MSCNSRALEYRGLVDDLVVGAEAGLLDDDEIAELRDMIARIERRVLANMPSAEPAREVG